MTNRMIIPLLLSGLMLLGVSCAQAGDMMKDGMQHGSKMMDKKNDMSDNDMDKMKKMDKMDKDMHEKKGMMHDHR